MWDKEKQSKRRQTKKRPGMGVNIAVVEISKEIVNYGGGILVH